MHWGSNVYGLFCAVVLTAFLSLSFAITMAIIFLELLAEIKNGWRK